MGSKNLLGPSGIAFRVQALRRGFRIQCLAFVQGSVANSHDKRVDRKTGLFTLPSFLARVLFMYELISYKHVFALMVWGAQGWASVCKLLTQYETPTLD